MVNRLFDDPAQVPDDDLPHSTVRTLGPAPATKPDPFKANTVKSDPFLSGSDKGENGVAIEKAVSVPLDSRGCVAPTTMEQSIAVAKQIVESELVPTRRWQDAWLIMQRGSEIGIKGLSAFDFIYVVKGRARVTPDCIKALALNSGQLVNFKEELTGDGKEDRKAIVTVWRKGIPSPSVYEFGWRDADRAGLLVGKSGDTDNYKKWADRMYLARARGFAFGDAFKDLTGGMQVREKFDRDPEDSERQVVETPDPLLSMGSVVDAEVVK